MFKFMALLFKLFSYVYVDYIPKGDYTGEFIKLWICITMIKGKSMI